MDGINFLSRLQKLNGDFKALALNFYRPRHIKIPRDFLRGKNFSLQIQISKGVYFLYGVLSAHQVHYTKIKNPRAQHARAKYFIKKISL